MKTEEYKSIEDLLDRFFEGQTSNEEERVLYKFFARPDIPAHLERYREVFGYFESGIALDFRETPELRLPAKESSNKRKIGWAIAVCVAASLLLFLVNQLFMGTEEVINPYEGSYIVRNGCVVTDLDRIQPEIEAIYQAAEAAEKEADLLLCDKNERKFISGMADRQVKENYQSLLRSVQDDRLRKEIKNILDSDE